MAVSLDQFWRRIVESGLMSADELKAVLASSPHGQLPEDGEQLARLLVKQKKLTAFQAQQLYAGKGKSLLLGNYVVLDKLGEGGMGMVLKAEHRRMERVVALKVLSPAITKNPEAVRRFQREVKAAARLEHANVVTAYDADEAAGTHFLVMQYVDGTDLAALVKEQGPLSVEKAVSCVLQAARGLEYAHARGVVHRDIKPANLLLDRDGQVKVLDMGLARLESARSEQDQLTRSGQIMGTVDYMAPEQACDTHRADARADVYSLGVTLWYLLTGRALYQGESAVARLLAHQKSPIPSLSSTCPEVSPELEAVFTRMVAKTPDARYHQMSEVIKDLEQCLGGSAAAPSLGVDPGDDTRLDEFLRALNASSGARTATKTARKPKAVSPALAPTVSMQSPQTDTDPQTEQALPSALVVGAGQWRHPPRRFGRHTWMAIAVAAILLLPAGMILFSEGENHVEISNPKSQIKPQAHLATPSPGDPDGSAAQWVLSLGGIVRVNDEEVDITNVGALPMAGFQLTGIDLQNRQFRDTDLARFQDCEHVKEIRLSGTQVSDAGLRYFRPRKDLKILALGGTRVTDPGLAHFRTCNKLVILALGQTQVTDAGLAYFQDCRNLTELALARTRVTDAGLAYFRDCNNLMRLNLYGASQITDAGLVHFQDCENLTQIVLGAETRVTDAGLANFQDCENLTDLVLNKFDMTDAGLANFRNCKNLTRLWIHTTKITDAGLVHFQHCTNVTSLHLGNTQITDAGLAYVAGMSALQQLNLTNTQVTSTAVAELHQKLPQCRIEWNGGTLQSITAPPAIAPTEGDSPVQ